MNYVEPIKKVEDIEAIKNLMLVRGDIKGYCLFVLGINTGLRVSDLLRIRKEDVQGKWLLMKEKKTGKRKKVVLNEAVRKAIDMVDGEGYLFATNGKPWSRVWVWKKLKWYAKEVGIENEIGTHTLRKTFGYQVYSKYKDIALVQKLLNHSKPEVSLRYIGIDQDEMDGVVSELNL